MGKKAYKVCFIDLYRPLVAEGGTRGVKMGGWRRGSGLQKGNRAWNPFGLLEKSLTNHNSQKAPVLAVYPRPQQSPRSPWLDNLTLISSHTLMDHITSPPELVISPPRHPRARFLASIFHTVYLLCVSLLPNCSLWEYPESLDGLNCKKGKPPYMNRNGKM